MFVLTVLHCSKILHCFEDEFCANLCYYLFYNNLLWKSLIQDYPAYHLTPIQLIQIISFGLELSVISQMFENMIYFLCNGAVCESVSQGIRMVIIRDAKTSKILRKCASFTTIGQTAL